MRGLVPAVAMLAVVILAGGTWMTGAQATVVDQAASGFTIENSQWVPTDPATSSKAFVEDVGKW